MLISLPFQSQGFQASISATMYTYDFILYTNNNLSYCLKPKKYPVTHNVLKWSKRMGGGSVYVCQFSTRKYYFSVTIIATFVTIDKWLLFKNYLASCKEMGRFILQSAHAY